MNLRTGIHYEAIYTGCQLGQLDIALMPIERKQLSIAQLNGIGTQSSYVACCTLGGISPTIKHYTIYLLQPILHLIDILVLDRHYNRRIGIVDKRQLDIDNSLRHSSTCTAQTVYAIVTRITSYPRLQLVVTVLCCGRRIVISQPIIAYNDCIYHIVMPGITSNKAIERGNSLSIVFRRECTQLHALQLPSKCRPPLLALVMKIYHIVEKLAYGIFPLAIVASVGIYLLCNKVVHRGHTPLDNAPRIYAVVAINLYHTAITPYGCLLQQVDRLGSHKQQRVCCIDIVAITPRINIFISCNIGTTAQVVTVVGISSIEAAQI